MGINNIILLLGGLGLFLFGMSYMGEGLELAAGPKMKDLLEKLTRNRVIGFLLGMLVTVVIQSSSATTVMVMGFINAGIMDLAQAAGVIMGANIGTTITSIIIALDVSGIAPLCICIGAAMMLYTKKKNIRYTGQVILGFGMLFLGLDTMSGAMAPLKDSQVFQEFILNAKNPLLGFLVGLVFCSVIQSSSAAVGVIQALAMQGLMPLHFGAYIICGINVGSATPALLSSFNAKNNAKRAALIYLTFNVIGSIIFIPLTMITPITSMIEAVVPDPKFRISMYHIIFKLVTGMILLPCINWVVTFTYKLVPKKEHESAFRLQYIDPDMQGSPAVMSLQVEKEVNRMADLVCENLEAASNGLINADISETHNIQEREQIIDYLAAAITDYLVKANSTEMPEKVARYLGDTFHVINDLEQIGDHAVKICMQTEKCAGARMTYSKSAKSDLEKIYEADRKLLGDALEYFKENEISAEEWFKFKKTEKKINRNISKAQSGHMERMKSGKCGSEQGLTFIEALNSYSRIVNHVSKIAEIRSINRLEAMRKIV